ncbi:TetR/AcrR family transcriptional regulator [Novosphingobium mangrovi (ex Hu et al. 2023)]|uniref:TetR/AcrR family transcriptional regulator n=1 Tax=Novosphingobium mangrovi (ex Hu et al. 2023) TaxID=2930094 RepID=A0ABT0AGZ0_9SPHN|nr:TetR/AcrR family transcriptional regulator [Novosphingobium mangrovi (ex Hu et al. 2023)]MCJ1962449.1 TetR/AcrR family transcriptional regulator [Novosphingobium mangrovi (ex Hu et al. 2023)]
MTETVPPALKARKRPVQRRSGVTVDAILEATLQVLLREGMKRLTTTRVAARAGVSVGTMYQYFPNKQALVYALNARYLDTLAERIEATCTVQRGVPMAQMVDALIDTYWAAKTERADVTRALYRSVTELDNDALVHAFAQRVDTATHAMLASACDLPPVDVRAINLALSSVIYGTVRNAFERGLPDAEAEALRDSLGAMCRAYLQTLASW